MVGSFRICLVNFGCRLFLGGNDGGWRRSWYGCGLRRVSWFEFCCCSCGTWRSLPSWLPSFSGCWDDDEKFILNDLSFVELSTGLYLAIMLTGAPMAWRWRWDKDDATPVARILPRVGKNILEPIVLFVYLHTQNLRWIWIVEKERERIAAAIGKTICWRSFDSLLLFVWYCLVNFLLWILVLPIEKVDALRWWLSIAARNNTDDKGSSTKRDLMVQNRSP